MDGHVKPISVLLWSGSCRRSIHFTAPDAPHITNCYTSKNIFEVNILLMTYGYFLTFVRRIQLVVCVRDCIYEFIR